MEAKTKAKMTANQAVSLLSKEGSEFLEGLSPAEAEMIVAKATYRRYAINTVITNEAEPANHLFLLLEGTARAYTLTPQGEKVGLGWFGAGKVVGWAALVRKRIGYVVSCEAAKTSSAMVWDRETILSLASTYPRLVENALLPAYEYLLRLRVLHVAAIHDTAPKRLGQVLGQLAKGMGRSVNGGFELHISNEELANEAHVTIFTVSRQMRNWQRDGLVKKSRGSVVVLQPDALLRIER
jgi:CRP/FNR family transcriptional regulator, nitrogen oxide reductase regulator